VALFQVTVEKRPVLTLQMLHCSSSSFARLMSCNTGHFHTVKNIVAARQSIKPGFYG